MPNFYQLLNERQLSQLGRRFQRMGEQVSEYSKQDPRRYAGGGFDPGDVQFYQQFNLKPTSQTGMGLQNIGQRLLSRAEGQDPTAELPQRFQSLEDPLVRYFADSMTDGDASPTKQPWEQYGISENAWWTYQNQFADTNVDPETFASRVQEAGLSRVLRWKNSGMSWEAFQRGRRGDGGGGDGGDGDEGDGIQEWLERILSGDFPTGFPEQPTLRDILPENMLISALEEFETFFPAYQGERETLARDLFQTRQADINRRLARIPELKVFARTGFRQAQAEARSGAQQTLLDLFRGTQTRTAESGFAKSGALQSRLGRGRQETQRAFRRGTAQRQQQLQEQLEQLTSQAGGLESRKETLANQFAREIYGLRRGYAEDIRDRLIDIMQAEGNLFPSEEPPEELTTLLSQNQGVTSQELAQYGTIDNPVPTSPETGTTWTDPWGNTWTYETRTVTIQQPRGEETTVEKTGWFHGLGDEDNGNGDEGDGASFGDVLEGYGLTPEDFRTMGAKNWRIWYENWYPDAPGYHLNLLVQSDAEDWSAGQWRDWFLEFTGIGGSPFN